MLYRRWRQDRVAPGRTNDPFTFDADAVALFDEIGNAGAQRLGALTPEQAADALNRLRWTGASAMR